MSSLSVCSASLGEERRLAALRELAILDTPPEERFDRIVRLARVSLRAPIALISLVDRHRQWFKANAGLEATTETTREISFCARAIAHPELMVVPDATQDPRFSANPSVTGSPGIRFYAGQPLAAENGERIGTLCVIDVVPREITAEERGALADLAAVAEGELRTRRYLEAADHLRSAHEQLDAERENFAAFMDHSPCVIYLKDEQSRSLFLNRRGEDIFQTKREKLLGCTDADWLPAETARRVMENDRRILETGQPQEMEEVVPGADGKRRYFLSLKFPIVHPSGRRLLGGVSVDMTAQREAEHRLQTIADNLPYLIAYVDADLRYRFVNRTYLEWHAVAQEQLLGKSLRETMGEDSWRLIQPQLERACRGERVRFEWEWENRYVEASYLPDMDETGRLQGLYVSVLDLTGRRRAEQAAQAASALNTAVLNNVNASIISTDEQGIIRTFNPTAERWLGYRAEEVVGHLHARLLHDAEEGRHSAQQLAGELGRPVSPGIENFRLRLERDGTFEREWTYIRKDGSRFPVLLSVTPVRDARGKFDGFVGIARDITLSKHAEEALREAKEAAEQANAAKSSFVAMMSHEVRTPLNGIMGLNAMLLDGDLPRGQRHLAEMMQRSAESLLTIVNDVLDFSKMEARRLDLELIDFDLPALLEDVVSFHEGSAAGKGLGLRFEQQPAVPARLRGDPMRLRQVLNNLLGNAIKFSPAGTVRLTVAAVDLAGPEKLLRFAVSDEGIGVSAEAQARIFEPFRQADSSTTREFGGTGLGLSICRQLVELMHGVISMESRADGGSTFWFTASFELARAPAAAPLRSKLAALPRMRVLVAEDSDVNRRIAAYQLSKFGCDVESVTNGEEAVAAVAGGAFDLVLMDCQMPVMDGFQAAMAIRQAEGVQRHTRIVALTANAMGEARERCAASGMDGYLSKPFHPSDLHAILAQSAADARNALEEDAAGNDPEPSTPAVVPPLALEEAEIDALWEDCGGGESFFQLVELFRDESVRTLQGMLQALTEGDLPTLQRGAHQLRGAAANFGARRVADLGRAVEAGARSGQMAEVAAPMAELPHAIAAALAALELVRKRRRPHLSRL